MQGYSILAQQFIQVRRDLYIKEVSIPVFGAKRYWYRFEFDKSRGQIHFRMFSICADKQPYRLLHEIKNGDAQEKADALAKWARGSLSLTAMRPSGRPNGELDITLARAPDGEWAPPKDSNAAGILLRGATSFREQCIACANSYCFHTFIDYCMSAPCRGAKVAENGGIRRERRMGAGVEATPGHWDTPGWPAHQKPALEADPRGYGKLSLERNARRMTQRSATHTIGWRAYGDVSALLLHSDPDHAEIDRVCKYALCCGRQGVYQPKIQRQIRKDAGLRVEERREAKALRAKLLSATVARRVITKADCMVEAGNLPHRGRSGNFRKVSLSGFRRLQATVKTGARTNAIYLYRARPVEDGRLSLYEFVSMMGDVPVFTGASMRPKWPPAGAYARAMLLLHKPWRQASDIRGDSSETWAPEFNLFLAQETCPMALKVNVERAKAVSRARGSVWEDTTQAEVADPEDYDEEGPRIYAPPR